MVGHGGSSASSNLADPTSPIPSHCASIVATSTVRVKCFSGEGAWKDFVFKDNCFKGGKGAWEEFCVHEGNVLKGRVHGKTSVFTDKMF